MAKKKRVRQAKEPRPIIMDLRAGIAAAVEGMNRAATNAGDIWNDAALKCVLDFPGDKFLAEDVRAWAEKGGMPDPPDKRAWGAVMVAARRQGIIVKVGVAESKSRTAHRGLVAQWVRVS